MVKTRIDLGIINKPEDAKNYSDYNGQPLTEAEKVIFDNDLLKDGKEPDGVTDKYKVNDLKDSVALLANLKEAQAKLKSERENITTNLTSNGNELLIALSEERRKNSIAYQLVNTDENGEKRVDAMVAEYQDILFREVNPPLVSEIAAKELEIVSIMKKVEDKKKELAAASAKIDPKEKQKTLDYQTKVNTIVQQLKDDLSPSQPGRRILDEIVRNGQASAYATSSTRYPHNSCKKTSYNKQNCYAHPLYLNGDLPWQFIQIFKEFDKDKLFKNIDNHFASDPDKDRLKETFNRIMSWTFSVRNIDKNNQIKAIQRGTFNFPIDEKNTTKGNDQRRNKIENDMHISDIFFFMNKLFPKGSDFSTNPFLQAGSDKCLPFSDAANLDKKYPVLWRARNDDASSIRYIDTSVISWEMPFPLEKLSMSWAGGELPEFFWQVYDDLSTILFNSKDDVLSKDGITRIDLRSEPISQYEKNLVEMRKTFRYISLLGDSYLDRVEDFINNGGIKFDDYEDEWNSVSYEIIYAVMDTDHDARQKAKEITYQEIIDRKLEVRHLVLNTETDVTDKIINIWDEMKDIAQAKVDEFTVLNAKRGEKLRELNKITKTENEARDELAALKASLTGIRIGGLANLKEQFERARVKPTKTWYDVLLMRQLLGLIYKVEKTPSEINKFKAYEAALDAAERARAGALLNYDEFKALPGANFNEKLTNWKEREGAGVTEEIIRGFLHKAKDSLENVGYRGLSPEETNDLAAITSYLDTSPEKTINDADLKLALFIDCRIPTGLTEAWKTFSNKSSKDFRTHNGEIKKIADIVNNLSDKAPFFAHLKDYVGARQTELPAFPDDDMTSERDKLEYFFKFNPEHVIGAIATYQIKTDSALKTATETAMKAAKNPTDDTKGLDLTVYGDGTNITEAGTIQFHSEELGGINHSYGASQTPTPRQDTPSVTPQAWYAKFGYWPVWGSLLLIGGGIIAYWKREVISKWWNGSAEEESDDYGEEED